MVFHAFHCDVTHHSLRPCIYHLRETELERAELLARHLMRLLHAFDAVRDRHDRVAAFLEPWRDLRLHVGLLLKHEAREKRNDFLGRICCERVFKDQLSEDEFVCRIDLG